MAEGGQRLAELERARERRAMVAARRLDQRARAQERRARERIRMRTVASTALEQPRRLVDSAALDEDLREPAVRLPA